MIAVLLISLLLLLLSLLGLGIKVLLKKNGQFKRHCASRDPFTGESPGCQCELSHACDERQRRPYQPLDVNEELLKETGTFRYGAASLKKRKARKNQKNE